MPLRYGGAYVRFSAIRSCQEIETAARTGLQVRNVDTDKPPWRKTCQLSDQAPSTLFGAHSSVDGALRRTKSLRMKWSTCFGRADGSMQWLRARRLSGLRQRR